MDASRNTAAALHEAITARRDDMLVSLAALVDRESPSTDKASLDRLAVHLAEVWRDIGASAAIIENSGHGNHVRVIYGGPIAKDESRAPALFLATLTRSGPLARRRDAQ